MASVNGTPCHTKKRMRMQEATAAASLVVETVIGSYSVPGVGACATLP